MSDELRHSPLDEVHLALGARMAPFGGWEMPIQYAGVLEEHRACREDAVVFDVSHLGSLRVTGHGARPGSIRSRSFVNAHCRVGRAQYTHLLDETDAHVVDDIIVWWLATDAFIVMPNASNTAPLLTALEDAARRAGDGACLV
ncbi:MAG: glycine cleavage system protein T, partial [Actinomycetota bacterium]